LRTNCLHTRRTITSLFSAWGNTQEIAAVYPHRRHLAAKVRVFIDALATRFAEHEWLNSEGAAPPG
jgi:hypothetical protein